MKLEANSTTLPRALSPDIDVSLERDVPAERHYTLNGKPERMAWVVLFGAFFVCIALSLAVPFLGWQFLRFSTIPQTASAESSPVRTDQVTPVRVTLPNVTLPIAVIEPTNIPENSRIETDTTDNVRAGVIFFDQSNVTLYKDTQIILTEMRQPQFGLSELPNSIIVEQTRGRAIYAVSLPLPVFGNSSTRAKQFLVRTPQFDVWLNPGSYTIEVNADASQVSVIDGSAITRSRDGSREFFIGERQRVVAQTGKPLADPIPAAQDLLVNGDFAEPIDCTPNAQGAWKCYSDQGGDGGDVNGSIGAVTLDNRRGIQIKREGSNQNSAITGIRQILDRDVSYYRDLKLSASVRVENHSLSGGGYLSTEYPLILRVRYRDVNGDEAEYVRGFYTQNENKNPTANGEILKAGRWNTIVSSNLLALPIKPFRILAIEIYGSGWDYESYISNVQLRAE